MGKRRITLDLEESMLEAADRAAGERSQSRSQYIAESLREALRRAERERIDAAFERMAEDTAYRQEMLAIDAELSPASDEVWVRIDSADSTTVVTVPAARKVA